MPQWEIQYISDDDKYSEIKKAEPVAPLFVGMVRELLDALVHGRDALTQTDTHGCQTQRGIVALHQVNQGG